MNNISILIPLKDRNTSKTITNCLSDLSLCRNNVHITLLHVFRKSAAEEDLMGKEFLQNEMTKFTQILQQAKDNLVEAGFPPQNIELKIATEPYPTITEGIIDQFNKSEKKFDIVVIRRRKMSKAEEFVLGDVCIKLVRALEGTSVLVVKPL